jgi:hypothetical protein
MSFELTLSPKRMGCGAEVLKAARSVKSHGETVHVPGEGVRRSEVFLGVKGRSRKQAYNRPVLQAATSEPLQLRFKRGATVRHRIISHVKAFSTTGADANPNILHELMQGLDGNNLEVQT